MARTFNRVVEATQRTDIDVPILHNYRGVASPVGQQVDKTKGRLTIRLAPDARCPAFGSRRAEWMGITNVWSILARLKDDIAVVFEKGFLVLSKASDVYGEIETPSPEQLLAELRTLQDSAVLAK